MKRIVTTTALAIAVAAPAAADTDMLRNALDDRFENVDVSTLTDEQVRALYAATAGTESAAELQRSVDSIVADSQYEMDEEAIMADPDEMARMGGSNDIRNAVQNMLATREVEADVATLTDAQVSALYLELTDSEPSNTELEAIIQ